LSYYTTKDNFVARLYTSYDSVTQFVSSYAVLNLYVYMMAYMYRWDRTSTDMKPMGTSYL
jgi:hypothetical protein